MPSDSELSSMSPESDDIKMEAPKSWGGDSLDKGELSTFRYILEQYGMGDKEEKDLLPRWSNGKRRLVQILGGHTLQARITVGDVDLASALLDGEFRASVWDPVYHWWERLPRDHYGDRQYLHPGFDGILFNRFSSGEKLSKRIAKDLSLETRESFLHQHSLLIAKCRAKGYVRLSVAPAELLTISDSATFTSCHCCKSTDGYVVGNFSYLIDSHTLVAYYWTDEKHSDIVGEKWPVKKWRQLIYVDASNLSAIVSRHYPNDRELLSKAARSLLFRKLAEYNDVEANRLIGPYYRANHGGTLGKLKNAGRAYMDTDCFRTVILKDGGEPPCIYLPVETVSLMRYACYTCRCRVSNDEIVRDFNDYYVCRSCWEKTSFRCTRCDNTYPIASSYSYDGDDEQYCSSCYGYTFTTCYRCSKTHSRIDMITVGWSSALHCSPCAEEVEEERERVRERESAERIGVIDQCSIEVRFQEGEPYGNAPQRYVYIARDSSSAPTS